MLHSFTGIGGDGAYPDADLIDVRRYALRHDLCRRGRERLRNSLLNIRETATLNASQNGPAGRARCLSLLGPSAPLREDKATFARGFALIGTRELNRNGISGPPCWGSGRGTYDHCDCKGPSVGHGTLARSLLAHPCRRKLSVCEALGGPRRACTRKGVLG